MRTAVLMVGNIRTWDHCKYNFNRVFGKLNPDIFITTYNRQYAYHPYISQSLNFYEDYDLDNQTIQSMFSGLNVKNIVIDDIDSYVDVKVKPFISPKFPRDAFLSLSQYFKLHDGMKKILEEEQASGFQYDCIIKTRFDITYNDFNINIGDENVYVDGSGAGVFPCDWIFISNRKNAIAIDSFIHGEMLDMKHESSLVDMPHKLFLNGIKSSGGNLSMVPLIQTLVRGK